MQRLLPALPLNPEQIETPQLHYAQWWWLASVLRADGKYFVCNGNHRVCAALLLGVCQPGPKRGAELGQNLRYSAQNQGVMGKCLSRGPGRNVARYGANVSRFTRPAAPKLTRFGAGIGILLQNCLLSLCRIGICRAPA